ncbi:type VI secretion system baseplate subunit TssF [Neptunomonas sp.]|uniref:type VI secretion system baseplate subunit TssF n=1 Tax=Neptunomonas sp. TaxID=1971898 RepID=UPI0025E50218|nr:type VI secretion system baseplate subunit TssF [Neptunomonas sp.]
MDPQLLKYYERELQFIKEMGSEYAKEYPKIASRLGIDGVETSDPYVERLYEGFAFLAARVQLRIDAEYPRFTQNIMNIVYPQYLSPTPSMAVVQFTPSPQANLEAGVRLPRGTVLTGNLKEGEQTACKYTTAHDVKLLPVKIKEAEYFSNVVSIASAPLPRGIKPKSGLRLRLSSTTGLPFNETPLNNLTVHFSGHGGQAVRLYEQVFGNACAVLLRSTESTSPLVEVLPVESIRQVGFSDNQSLLPDDSRSFSGYRLLREYFAFSDRFLFADFTGLGSVTKRCKHAEIDLIILFDRYDPELENRVTINDFSLFCTPAINLFPKRADRVHLSMSEEDYHVVPDRTRPTDFEVFQVDAVTGYGTNADEKQVFLPFYACNDLTDFVQHQAYYGVRRERRILSMQQRQRGPRSSYIGSETYVSLVDVNEAPFSNDLKQLEVQTLCTNRDLPLKMATGRGSTDFSLDISAPVASICCVSGPTKPKPSLSHKSGEAAWRLINHLSLNYLSLADDDKGGGAAALRELMSLYGDSNDAAVTKQIEGIRSIHAVGVTRRIPLPGPIAFGRGLEITIVFDESAFVGSGIFLLGSVLDNFFARYVSINSFTETVIKSEDRGEVMKWPVRIGQRQII